MNALRNPQLLVVAGVVGVALVGWVLRQSAHPPTLPAVRADAAMSEEGPVALARPVASVVSLTAGVPDVTKGLSKVAYTAESARDPFVSLLPTSQSAIAKVVTPAEVGAAAGKESAIPLMKIQGIIWGGPRPQAVIDGEVYDVGDTVQGTRIVQIDRTGVTGEVKGRLIRWAPE